MTVNVLMLGTVSLVTDISSEMVTAILPLYLVLSLGLTPLQFGVLDGMYFGVTALVRLLGGHLADRWQRRKLIAGFGYGLSAICKLGLLVVGPSPLALGAVLAADRTGKGLRTAPRDALITLSTDPKNLGMAFGVHRAMDTAGALAGPLVAFAVLWAAPGAYDAVFVVSCCIAMLGVLLLVAFVRDQQTRIRSSVVSIRAALRLLADRRFGRMCAATALLGLVTISDSFVYLLLQRRLGIAAGYFPLLPLGTAASFLVLALPLGRLSDRVGPRAVFLGGHIALLGAYVLLRGPFGGLPMLICVLTLHGAFYAATDGVLMAAAGPLLPDELRTSGVAVLQTGQAVARLMSSVLIGALWTVWGVSAAVTASAVALGLMLLVAVPLLRSPLRRAHVD
ncbi:MAG: multidrug-efflux transporter [Actinomycetia bacterium]|nr:multidrug-efflux transporter [Actinomycetes bacterium]